MSINDLFEKVKPFYTLLLCVAIASIFFCLGRLSAIEERKTPVRIIQPENGQTANVISAISSEQNGEIDKSNVIQVETAVNTQEGEVIGSKNGTKYYYPWCGSLKIIKPENRVTFASAELARKAGYTPAANCKGLK